MNADECIAKLNMLNELREKAEAHKKLSDRKKIDDLMKSIESKYGKDMQKTEQIFSAMIENGLCDEDCFRTENRNDTKMWMEKDTKNAGHWAYHSELYDESVTVFAKNFSYCIDSDDVDLTITILEDFIENYETLRDRILEEANRLCKEADNLQEELTA